MTASDVAALVSSMNANKEGGFLEGNGIIIIILFFFILIFAGGFGGNTGSAVTQEYIANQFTNRDLYNNNTNILTSAAATQTEILNNRYNCSQNYSNLRYESALGNANLEKDILLGDSNIQAQMAQNALQAQANLDSCCCTLRSEMRDQIQSVKDLINNNTIQDLRDQLNLSNMATANSVQTNNILSNIGRFYINTPINPYYGYASSYPYGTSIM